MFFLNDIVNRETSESCYITKFFLKPMEVIVSPRQGVKIREESFSVVDTFKFVVVISRVFFPSQLGGGL